METENTIYAVTFLKLDFLESAKWKYLPLLFKTKNQTTEDGISKSLYWNNLKSVLICVDSAGHGKSSRYTRFIRQQKNHNICHD